MDLATQAQQITPEGIAALLRRNYELECESKVRHKEAKMLRDSVAVLNGKLADADAKAQHKQVLSPRLVDKAAGEAERKQCGLVFNLALVRPGQGVARVWWVKDGSLVGPVRLVGPTGAAALEIVCAGDRPGSLSEWASRGTWTFFPDKLVLSVARRLAGGLDTLLPQLAAQEGITGQLLRQANAMTGFRNLLPTRGRPCLALAGPFHASLKAFSLRSGLELSPG